MRALHCIALCLGLFGAGCATHPCKVKSPATLLAWAAADSPKEKTDDNGKAEENGDAAEAPEPIATDRPDFTESSTTVGRGRIQLEMGYTYSRDRDSGVSSAHSFPEALLRVGLFAEWFEFRIGQNYSNTRTLGVEGPFSTSGGEDLYLGVKLALTEQAKWLPETALILQTTVPTGPDSLTADRVLPGLNLLYGWDVNDFLSLAGSSQGNAAVDDDGHGYLELAQSFTAGYTLTEKLGAYTEFFGFFPHGATAPGVTPELYFNGGFTYKVTPDFQIDVRAGVGLNRTSDDYFVGTGFGYRY